MTGDRLSANYVAQLHPARPVQQPDARRRSPSPTPPPSRYFVRDNVVEGRDELTKDNARLFDRRELDGRARHAGAAGRSPRRRCGRPRPSTPLRDVLAGAGATLPRRDAVDARLVREVEQRSGRIIDSQKEVGGWPRLPRSG